MESQSHRRHEVTRADPFATRMRQCLTGPEDGPDGPWRDLLRLWFALGGAVGSLPAYDDFDILALKGRHWEHICLTKLIGSPRHFQVIVIGSAIEAHNGFYGNQRPMRELPLKNREVMRREFAWTLRHGGPVFSAGPYIGAADYVRGVRRLITPYRITAREYAFLFYAHFELTPARGRTSNAPL